MFGEIFEELLGLVRDPASISSLSTGSKVVLGVLTSLGVHAVIKSIRGRRRRRYDDPPDTVVLVCGPRGPFAPSLVPFAVKLETFLRMTSIPYKTEEVWNPSRKGKMPWLRYNGEEVADSTFCIQFLSKKFSKNVNSHLSPEQRAIGRAFTKMMEENTYWTMVTERWVYNDSWFLELFGLPPLLYPLTYIYMRRAQARIRHTTWQHGIGRHSKEELLAIMEDDLNAVSDFLGDKEFLFGSVPCEADCAVFGQLSQFLWQMPAMLGEQLLREKFPKLRAYCLRMKQRYWKDWNAIVPKHRDV